MTVFKHYLKLQKKHSPMMIMYLVICVGVSMLISQFTDGGEAAYVESRGSVAIENHDDSIITEGFLDYVAGKSDVVTLSEDGMSMVTLAKKAGAGDKEAEKALDHLRRDAVFEREVDAILIIPEGFGAALMEGGDGEKADSTIDIIKVPDAAAGYFLELQYDRYLNLARLLGKAGYSQKEAVDEITSILETKGEVQLLHEGDKALQDLVNYYNFSNYGVLAILIYGMGLCLLAFNEKKMRDRSLSSGIPRGTYLWQLFLANGVFTLIVFLVFVLAAAVLFKGAVFGAAGRLMIINFFVFTLSAMAMAFLLAQFAKTKESVTGMMNIFGLGTSFLCGAFVPQAFLGKPVLAIGRLFPSYWYISNTNGIMDAVSRGSDMPQGYVTNLLIVVAFAVGFLLLAFFVGRFQRAK